MVRTVVAGSTYDERNRRPCSDAGNPTATQTEKIFTRDTRRTPPLWMVGAEEESVQGEGGGIAIVASMLDFRVVGLLCATNRPWQ